MNLSNDIERKKKQKIVSLRLSIILLMIRFDMYSVPNVSQVDYIYKNKNDAGD